MLTLSFLSLPAQRRTPKTTIPTTKLYAAITLVGKISRCWEIFPKMSKSFPPCTHCVHSKHLHCCVWVALVETTLKCCHFWTSSFTVLYLHEDGYSHYSNYPSSSVHWDSINRIVNPEDYEHPREEKVGESSNSGDNARSPRFEDIAASADGDHAGYRAVDRLEQRVFPACGFRDEEADYATRATSHL